ncbi:hypothetical protein K8O93_01195 [Gordonia bronchialis]|uniref:aggregation-promoting factor C-terminal-like domain-containing protein n=1 Tax=Gordonia bronchialis TaxID=2054 RepID=UPI001CBF35CD|nr:hypothetical protein [Gordonia bronchialis]UAK38450.1 hypothetical protein K8O93_01195 [Gordonia bronchialis]
MADGKLVLQMVPDGTGFEQRVQAITRTVRAKVDVSLDADWEAFERRIETASRTTRPTVHVDLDADIVGFAARLEARLATIRPTIRVRLDIDDDELARIQALLGSLGNLGGGLGGGPGGPFGPIIGGAGQASNSIRGIGRVAGPAFLAVAALAALSLIPLAASASQALGVFALFPAVVGAAGASLATLVIGASGIAGAFQAASAAAESAGQNAVDMARQQRNAAEEVTRAQEAVSEAYRDQGQAQEATRRATRDLNDAYRDQARELRDVNDQLEDAILSTEDAAIGVARAKQNYARTVRERRSGKADDLDVQEADLRVRQALSRYDQQKKQTADLREDTARANREGIEGSDRVRDAKQRVLDTQHQEVLAARQVRDAQLRLRDAYEAQADAIKGVGGPMDQFAKAMAKLSPNAQDFVSKILSLSGAWRELRMSVQDKLFDGLGDKVVGLANNAFPVLEEGLGRIATAFNTGFKNIIDVLNQPDMADKWREIFSNTAVFVERFLTGLGKLGHALSTITQVGSRFLPGFGQGFENAMTRFDNWITKLSENGKLQKFMQDAIDKFKELWRLGGEIVELIKNIFGGAKEPGDGMLKGLTDTLERWNQYLGTPEGQKKIEDFFTKVKDTVSDIKDILEKIVWLSDKLSTLNNTLGNGPGGEKGPIGKNGENLLDNANKFGFGPSSPAAVLGPASKAQDWVARKLGAEGGFLGNTDLNPFNGMTRYRDKNGRAITEDGKEAYSGGKFLPDIEKDSALGKFVGIFTGDTIKMPDINWDSILPDGIGEKLKSLKDGFSGLGQIGSLAGTAIKEKWNEFTSWITGLSWSDLFSPITQQFNVVGEAGKKSGEWVKQKYDELVEFVRGLGSRIGEAAKGMWDGLGTAFKTTVQWIIEKWNSLKLEIKIPAIKIAGKTVYDGTTVTLGVPKIPDVIPKRAQGGSVPAARDERGVLSGPGTSTSDSILGLIDGVPAVAVSRDEKVMSERSRRGGNDAIQDAMNAGLVIPASRIADVLGLAKRADGGNFADYQTPPGVSGGTVTFGNISGEGITTGTQQSMWDHIRTKFPEAQLFSATRTVQTEGHQDFHNLGKAIDISPMQAIADHIAATFGNRILEMFWDPGPNYDDGKPTGAIGGHCVPLDVEILTRRGWLPYDQVRVGDETPGLNPATGRTEWTRITHLHRYDDMEVIESSGRGGWAVRSTPNHRWIASDLRRPGRFREITTEETTTHRGHNLAWVTAAPLADGPGLALTHDEAELIGWLVADGSQWESVDDCRFEGCLNPARSRGLCGSHRRQEDAGRALRPLREYPRSAKTDFSVFAWQTKPSGVARLAQILGENASFNGKGFRLRDSYARSLLSRAGITHIKNGTELLEMAAAATAEQRDAVLRGILGGDGTVSSGHRRIYQDRGPVLEVIAVLAYYCGIRPNVAKRDVPTDFGGHGEHMSVKLNSPRILPRHSRSLGRTSVWCPSTELGSWTARFGDNVALTHNSDHVHWAMDSPLSESEVLGKPPVGDLTQDDLNGDNEGTKTPDAWSPETNPKSPDEIANTDRTDADDSKKVDGSSWSELLGSAADAAVSGYVADTLGVLGIKDELPGIVQAGTIAYSELFGEERKKRTNPNGSTNAPLDVTTKNQDEDTDQTTTKNQNQNTDNDLKAPNANRGEPGSLGGFVADTPEGGIAAGTPGAKEAVFREWAKHGWNVGALWLDTLRLLNGESSWRVDAKNPSSTAYGLFQFLDTTQAQFPYGDTAEEQAVGGAAYIKSRADYGDPSKAYAMWLSRSPHWYRDGGRVRGAGGPREDRVPIWASNGEFVVNADATEKFLPWLETINGYADGGLIDIDALFSGVNQSISDASATAMTSAASAVPYVGPAAAQAVQTGVSAMRTVNDAVKRGLGIAEAVKAGVATTQQPKAALPNQTASLPPQEVHFHGRDWREAYERKRIADAQALAAMGGSKG